MKTPTFFAAALGTVLVSHSPGAGLMVDFGGSASPVAADFQGYAATNAAPDPAAVVYTAASTGFSADVTLDVDALLDNVLVTSNTPANLFRVIDRTATAAALATPNADLYRDWIAASQLAGQPETGLRITVVGLEGGTYNWDSWHHDVADQSGVLDVSFKVGGSAVNTQTQIDVSNGTAPAANANNTPFLGSTALTNEPLAFSQQFTISLGQTVVFEPTSRPARRSVLTDFRPVISLSLMASPSSRFRNPLRPCWASLDSWESCCGVGADLEAPPIRGAAARNLRS